MSWTDERVELLKKLWSEGRTASQIAGELSNGITRNAVIGKVHRLGLPGRVKAPSMSMPRPRAPKPRINRPMMRGANALALAPRPIEDVAVLLSNPVTIIDLRESMCKWPLGDPTTPEFRYCGAASPVGVSYCTFHSHVAYQPAQDRRRERDRGHESN